MTLASIEVPSRMISAITLKAACRSYGPLRSRQVSIRFYPLDVAASPRARVFAPTHGTQRKG
jgi:hypothetical protein